MIQLVPAAACRPPCRLARSLALTRAPSVNAIANRVPAVPQEATRTWWNTP